jgi:hypothetical protein
VPSTRAIAVDWSGRRDDPHEAIWIAVADDGRLVALDNGFSRAGAVARVIELAGGCDRTAIGIDFAFGFPRWFCERNGWPDGPAAWRAAADHGESRLRECEWPFWGRTGRRNELAPAQLLRQTDLDLRPAAAPKSVFQIGGAGAVGTGSLRGMPHLIELARAGVSVWPFDARPGWPRAVEIYPRLLTGPVVKSRHRERRDHLARALAGQDAVLAERAAGSEDAFDAAVSAVAMARVFASLEALPAAGEPYRIEGRIWRPEVGAAG